MKNYNYLLLMKLLILATNSGVAQYNKDPIGLVQSESISIFKNASIYPTITWKENSENIAKRSSGIYFGKSYFIEQAKRMSPEDYLFLVRFIITHELAHQIQFRIYDSLFMQDDCEKKQLFECQADVVSGIMMGRLYDLTSESSTNRDIQTIEAGLAFIYDQGDNEYGVSLHPTPIARRSAFRYGLGYKVSNKNRLIIEKAPDDFFSSADSIRWSFEIAKMIMHYPIANAHKIICIQSDTSWEKGIDHPYVHFRETYLNTGSKPIRVNIIYEVCGDKAYHRRLYHDTVSTHAKLAGDSKWVSVIIEPGKKSEITGALNWLNVSTTDYMPTMIFSRNEDALYSAEELNSEGVNHNIYNYCPNDYASSDPKSKLDEDIFLFRYSLDQSVGNLLSENWKKLEAGFGLNLTGKLLYYRSVLRFPYSVDNQVMLFTDTNSVFITSGYIDVSFYRGPDKQYGLNKFRQISTILKDHYGPHEVWEEYSSNDNGYRHSVETKLKKQGVNISLSLMAIGDEWLVHIFIESKLKPYSMSKLNPERLAPIENPGESVWIDEIIHDIPEGFTNIHGEFKARSFGADVYKLKINLPKYIYISELSHSTIFNRSEVKLLLCQSDNREKAFRQFDSLKSNILASLKKHGLQFSLDDPNNQDSGRSCEIFLNSRGKKAKEDIELTMRYPHNGGYSKDYYLALRFYHYDSKR